MEFKEGLSLFSDSLYTGAHWIKGSGADEIDVEGYVIGHPDQTFNISVNHKTLETGHLVMSPELDLIIQARE